MHSILRKIFNAIAQYPLIGPHNNREAELLQSGAKPTGIVRPTEELEAAVEDGDLIKLEFNQEITQNYRIYCVPGEEGGALSRHQERIQNHWAGASTQNDNEIYSPYRGVRKTTDSTVNKITGLMDRMSEKLFDVFLSASSALGKQAEAMRITAAIDEIEAGNMHSISFFEGYMARHDDNPALSQKLAQAVDNGNLTYVDTTFTTHFPMTLYGQPDREAEMIRLKEILNGDDMREPGEDAKLMGYADEDIDLWTRGGYHSMTNPVTRFILTNTQSLRRRIRQTLMLEDGADWQRNMDHVTEAPQDDPKLDTSTPSSPASP